MLSYSTCPIGTYISGSYRKALGDADAASLERKEQRDNRYNRTQVHLAIMEAREELDVAKKEIVMLKRIEKKAKSQLRYTSALFLEDMKIQERAPMEHMQRKADKKQFARMWGGHGLHDTSVDVPGRFETSTQASFQKATATQTSNDNNMMGLHID